LGSSYSQYGSLTYNVNAYLAELSHLCDVWMNVEVKRSTPGKTFEERETILGRGISVLGQASLDVKEMDGGALSVCGDLAYDLLAFAPGYAGKLLLIISRLFSSAADTEGESSFSEKIKPPTQVLSELDQLELLLG